MPVKGAYGTTPTTSSGDTGGRNLAVAGGAAAALAAGLAMKNPTAAKAGLKKLAEVITNQAVHTNRLDNQGAQIAVLQKELSDLRRGEGWITGRRGIDGEYPR